MEGNSRRGQGSRGTVAPEVVVAAAEEEEEKGEEKEDLSTSLGDLNKITINLDQGICCSDPASTPATPEYKLEALSHERNKLIPSRNTGCVSPWRNLVFQESEKERFSGTLELRS
jgi:hypothetical protein